MSRGGPGGSWEGLKGVLGGVLEGPGGVLGASREVLGGFPVRSWTDLGARWASEVLRANDCHPFMAHLGPQRAPQGPSRLPLWTPKK